MNLITSILQQTNTCLKHITELYGNQNNELLINSHN